MKRKQNFKPLLNIVMLGSVFTLPFETKAKDELLEEQRAIYRSCYAGYKVRHLEADNVPDTGSINVGDYAIATRGCGATVPNRCRRRARDALLACMRAHVEGGGPIMPDACKSNGVNAYAINDLQEKIQTQACLNKPGSTLRLAVDAVVAGDRLGNEGCVTTRELTSSLTVECPDEPVPQPNTPAELSARYETHRLSALNNMNEDGLIIQAYEKLPLDQQLLLGLVESLPEESEVDFDIIKLVRILYLADAYDNAFVQGSLNEQRFVDEQKILEELKKIDFWLTVGETSRTYWSENHLIMWMGSEWLLQERDSTWQLSSADLRSKLVHYLGIKVDVGFYEFFSPNYIGYTFSGLLNLAEFAQDQEIRSLANQAITRLLDDALLPTTTEGTLLAAAGRGARGKYSAAENIINQANHINLLRLLTGKGEVRPSATAATAFLATTEIDFSSVVDGYQPYVNLEWAYGHPHGQSSVIHQDFSRSTRTLFQWSFGGYMHPDFIADTVSTVDFYNLRNHKSIKDIPSFALNNPDLTSDIGGPVTRSSVISGGGVDIYKHNGVSLTSMKRYYRGYHGYQQMPWVAALGSLSVFTVSGDIDGNLLSGGGVSNNSHLPWVQQEGNVALITYWPLAILKTLANADAIEGLNVGLHWPEDEMDQHVSDRKWAIGRKGDNYVAVYIDCKVGDGSPNDGKINGIYACQSKYDVAMFQVWAAVVGNQASHGSFDNFVAMIKQAHVSVGNEYYTGSALQEFSSRITVDGKTVGTNWTRAPLARR